MAYRAGFEHEGMRADAFLRQTLSWPRADVLRLFDQARVRCGPRRLAKGDRLHAGDVVEVSGDAPASLAAQPDPSVAVRVLYSDTSLLVVDKPAGLSCHPLRAGELGCLANGLVSRYPELSGVGYEARQPGLVNRLDNDTSGLLLVARSTAAFEFLRRELREGRIEKEYLAVCERAPKQGDIDLPLAPDPSDARRVRGLSSDADDRVAFREARTCVTGVERWHGVYRVELQAHRARRHQVRAHLAAVGCPILGDPLYGGRAVPEAKHLLHASRMVLRHPKTGQRVECRSAVPADWDAILRRECAGRLDP